MQQPNAVYTATDCFSSGLDNMQPGKCYGINPDRAPHYGWINNNANDPWWWVERACDCSALAEPVTSGGCKYNKQGANVVYTVDDCFSDGLDYMEQGKCYSINPDRAPHYGWMNNDARDRYWWREVECEGDDEWEDDPIICPGSGSSFLGKKSYAGENYNSKETVSYDSYEVWGKNTKVFYDALGRKTQAHPETRRYLFSPKTDRSSRFGTFEDNLFRMILPDGRICGVEGYDYGIVFEGRLKGGNYCYHFNLDSNWSRRTSWIKESDNEQLCIGNDSLVNLTLEYKYKSALKDSVYYVKSGYDFPDTNYTTTNQDEVYFRKHEERHLRDTRKILETRNTGMGPAKKIFINKTICASKFCEWKDRVVDSLRNDRINFYKAKIDSANDYYHDQCYNHENCR
jgi:hypothetical protein